jgi:hypothetical protein
VTGATLAAEADASSSILVCTTAVADKLNTVVRVKGKKTTTTAGRQIFLVACEDAAVRPTGAGSSWEPYMSLNKTGPGVEQVVAAYGVTNLFTYAAAATTFYLGELYWTATNSYATVRDATTIASLATGNTAHAYADSIWPLTGDDRVAAASTIRSTVLVEYFQMFKSTNITVTGCPTASIGYIYEADGTLISSAVCAAGTITLDCQTCDFNSNPDLATGGFNGYIVITDSSGSWLTRYDSRMFWGGDAYAYTANVAFAAGVEPKKIYISISDPSGTGITQLTEGVNLDRDNTFMDLSFESTNPGGFTVASFAIMRPVTKQWVESNSYNEVTIGAGSQRYWQGFIDKPTRSINPDKIEIACLGWSARLNEMATYGSDFEVNVPLDGLAYKASTFINDVMLADPAIDLVDGGVSTTDFEYAIGVQFAFTPYTTYASALEQLNAGNNWDYGVWLDKGFYFGAKTPTTIEWFVYTKDCPDITMTYLTEALINRLVVCYSQDGTTPEYTVLNDTTSQTKYGRVIEKQLTIPGMIITADAAIMGQLYLDFYKTLKVSAEFTTSKVYDANGNEGDLRLVRAGDNIRIVDWFPGAELIGAGVTDISTYQIKNASYSHNDATLSITPTDFLSSTEIQMARLGAPQYSG